MHIFAVSSLICEMNKPQPYTVPSPHIVMTMMKDKNALDEVIRIAGDCVNEAFSRALEDARAKNEVFDSAKWLKTIKAVTEVGAEIRRSLKPLRQSDRDFIAELKEKLKMSKRDFEPAKATD